MCIYIKNIYIDIDIGMSTKNINSTLVTSVYKSRKNILKQLHVRGFDIQNYDNFSIHDVHIMITTKQLDMLVKDDNDNKIYIKFAIFKKLNQNHIFNTLAELFDYENILNKPKDEIIFIIKDEPNDTLVQVAKEVYNNENIFISLVNIKRLQFNILEHVSVPKHEILNENEEKMFLEEFNILDKTKQIPTISRFDPVSIAIGLRPKQICKITRPSKTAIYGIYYRICV